MQMNTNQNEIIKKAEQIMSVECLRTSKHPDAKNVFKAEEKEKSFKKRYGRDVKITVTYEGKDGSVLKSFDDLKEYTLRFQSAKNAHYAITEYLVNGGTDKVILSYVRNGRLIENSFNRPIDAEITLVDLIGDE